MFFFPFFVINLIPLFAPVSLWAHSHQDRDSRETVLAERFVIDHSFSPLPDDGYRLPAPLPFSQLGPVPFPIEALRGFTLRPNLQ